MNTVNLAHKKIPQTILYTWYAALLVLVLGILHLIHQQFFVKDYFNIALETATGSVQDFTLEGYRHASWITTFFSGFWLILFGIFAYLMHQGKNAGRIVVSLVALLNIVFYVVSIGQLPIEFKYAPVGAVIRILSVLSSVAILYFIRADQSKAYFAEVKSEDQNTKVEQPLKSVESPVK
ncbi:MAG: hypothetical protein QM632_05905 [Micrococcaceae bacterium]